MTSEKELRIKLYEGIRSYRSGMKEFSTYHGCSTQWTYKVLKGEYDDPDLLLAAAKWLKKRNKVVEKYLQVGAEAISTLPKN